MDGSSPVSAALYLFRMRKGGRSRGIEGYGSALPRKSIPTFEADDSSLGGLHGEEGTDVVRAWRTLDWRMTLWG
jgi:hypothetical protein